MIVFVDANALMQDPMCAGTTWQVVAHAPETWDLRLVTSEVAVAEAVAGYSRAISEAIASLDKATRPWGRLGAVDVAEPTRAALAAKAESYRAHLEASLNSLNVEVLSAPDVSHMDIVARSTARRRPCDDEGNGYRDTLIWLTVVKLASDNADEQLILVTRDSDFMDEGQEALHPHLQEDLAAVEPCARVRLSKNLADVLLELAAETADAGDLRALRSRLKDETVRRFLSTLAEASANTGLDPRRCALPLGTSGPFIQDVGEPRDVVYTVKGGLAEGEGIAEFSFEADTRIVFALQLGTEPDEYEATLPMPGSGKNVFVQVKPLLFRGVLRMGRFDAPLAGEISEIAARKDDAGHGHWRRATRAAGGSMADLIKGINVNPMADLIKNINVNPMADVIKGINVNPMADLIKNINIDPMADVIKGINVNPMADLIKNINIDPIADVIKNINIDPIADSVTEPADDSDEDDVDGDGDGDEPTEGR